MGEKRKHVVFNSKITRNVSKTFELPEIDFERAKFKVVEKESAIDKLEKQIKVVNTAIERYRNSTNKKNTVFIQNNLNKLIAGAQELLEEIK